MKPLSTDDTSPTPASDSRLKVFMVDDEPSIAEAVGLALAIEPDMQFEFQHNPYDAILAAEKFQPNIILLDLVMPEMDGLTLLQRIRTTSSLAEVPVIVLSGEEMPATKRQAFELGANDYLVKLPSRIELVARIRAHAKAYLNQQQRDAAYVALEAANRQLAEALALVKVEQEKSERLLLNILPKPIADRLKDGEATIADSFHEVTVLFADVVGFTAMSSHLKPTEVVMLLNEIFSRFDLLAAALGLEKIKTIGDAYMAVGNLPILMENHAEAVAELALRMRDQVTDFNREACMDVHLRIGINTGPVIAGVIGRKKFIYDLWGDTVNIANRMEAQGEPDAIQITEATYERIKNKYRFTKRGLIEVKGKGKMTVYWLDGRLGS